MIFDLWKIDLWKTKCRSHASSKNVEDKAIKFAAKHVCGNCCMRCEQIDLLCGCVRYYINAFQDGYRECEEDKKMAEEKMTEEKNNISEKLEKESFDLFTKLQKLAVFIGSERYKKLPLFHRYLLRRQFHFMRKYHQILVLRQKDLKEHEGKK